MVLKRIRRSSPAGYGLCGWGSGQYTGGIGNINRCLVLGDFSGGAYRSCALPSPWVFGCRYLGVKLSLLMCHDVFWFVIVCFRVTSPIAR